MKLTLQHLKGLNALCRKRWGDHALVPRKQEPFRRTELLRIIAFLAAFSMAGWSVALHRAVSVLVCFCLATGMRRDEWTRTYTGDTSYMRRNNFAWFDGAAEIYPSLDGLARIRNGCYLRGVSAPSKCDRDNLEWGAKHMWFLVDESNPLNFASQYLAYERAYPCPPEDRHRWAAFSPDGTAEPFAYARAASLLASLLSVLGIAARTWHAFRVTLACAIFGTGLPNKEALCQALLRWKSPASVAIYAKMAPSDYATAIERSNATCAHPQRDLELPDFDPSGQAADLQLAVDQLERDLRGAKAALAATNSADAGSSKDPVSSAAVTASAPATASAPRTEPKAAKPRKRGGAAGSSRPSNGARVEIFLSRRKGMVCRHSGLHAPQRRCYAHRVRRHTGMATPCLLSRSR